MAATSFDDAVRARPRAHEVRAPAHPPVQRQIQLHRRPPSRRQQTPVNRFPGHAVKGEGGSRSVRPLPPCVTLNVKLTPRLFQCRATWSHDCSAVRSGEVDEGGG